MKEGLADFRVHVNPFLRTDLYLQLPAGAHGLLLPVKEFIKDETGCIAISSTATIVCTLIQLSLKATPFAARVWPQD